MNEIKDIRSKLNIGVSIKDIVAAIKDLSEEERGFFVENIMAATSPDYLESIKEARKDYKEGRTISHEEMFKE